MLSSAPHEVFQQPASFAQTPHSLSLYLCPCLHGSHLTRGISPCPLSHGCVYHLHVCSHALYICEHICMTGGAHMYLCEVMRAHCGEQELHMHAEVWISCQEHPHCSFTIFIESGSAHSQTPELADMSGLFSQLALEISNLCLPGLRYHIHGVFTSIAGDLSAGSHAYTENALTTRPSPKLQWRLLMQTTIHLSSLVLSVTVAFITVISLMLLLHDK